MVSLKATARRRRSVVTPHLTMLSVSWLNKQFKAVAMHRGVIEGTWEYPGEIEGASHFDALIREAAQQTQYRGQSVCLVLGHQRLAQQVLDVPPVKGSSLKKLIDRQAQQQKFFVGEAACACQTSLALKGNQRVILHLFPKILLHQLVQACRQNNLHLMSVIPPSAVVHEHLMSLPLAADETTLLAAETAGATTLVIARGDGMILLCRTLPGTWNEEPDRLALDINRTVLFASQQYGAAISRGIWLFGQGAKEKAPAIQRQIQLPVRISPGEAGPFYWATEALKLHPGQAPNFISSKLQRAPQRRVFAKVVLAVTLLAMLGSIGISAYAWVQAKQEEATIKSLMLQYGKLRERHRALLKRDAEFEGMKGAARLVLDGRPPAAPAWFLAYLGEAVPPEMVVTNLRVAREPDSWRFQISGTFQESGKEPSRAELANSIRTLKSRLTQGPFHAAIVTSSDQAKEEPRPAKGPDAPSSPFGWIGRVSMAPPTNAPPCDNFRIEGVVR